ncbi:bile acid:sodium symporter [Sediminispirochaeta bajacaliforniensis]|uniref:bile acid:sodium symporter n=1 Tax=Sediminispirochaeta bajacaliforniensis TaxID=148 RepID=UPI00037D7E16|nr:bile acid:sodium symporter [Sediminispirochaeta bajacaliforniensis]
MDRHINFFLVLAITLFITWFLRDFGGMLNSHEMFATVTIMLMYVGMGITTDSRQLLVGLRNWKLILFSQFSLFGLSPILAYGIFHAVMRYSHLEYAIGLLFLGCLPTTITSCIMLTKEYGGNTVGALYNSIVSQFLGLLLTPLLLSTLLATQFISVIPFSQVVENLCQKMIIPFAIGQFLRQRHVLLGRIPGIVTYYGIFFILYMKLAATFCKGDLLEYFHLLSIPLIGVFAFCSLLLLLVSLLTVGCKFSRKDQVCSIFTGTQKTMGMGIPLATIYFPKNVEIVSSVSLLIIFYYILIMVGAAFVVVRILPKQKI